MKIKVGSTATQCEILNDDGSPLPFMLTSFSLSVSADPSDREFFPVFRMEGYLPAGSTIEVDGRSIEVFSHERSEEVLAYESLASKPKEEPGNG